MQASHDVAKDTCMMLLSAECFVSCHRVSAFFEAASTTFELTAPGGTDAWALGVAETIWTDATLVGHDYVSYGKVYYDPAYWMSQYSNFFSRIPPSEIARHRNIFELLKHHGAKKQKGPRRNLLKRTPGRPSDARLKGSLIYVRVR
jgi:hypothetical protein